jgi:hypothetical protein
MNRFEGVNNISPLYMYSTYIDYNTNNYQIHMQKNTIEIISFKSNLTDKVRLNLTLKIINESTSDLLLFSGHTLDFVNDIESLREQIKNTKTEVILELKDINSDMLRNCLYRISKGKLFSLNTNQIFATSGQIENNYELGRRLFYEFESHRTLLINGMKILILQCGELNILKNYQNDNNRVEFRLSDDSLLNDIFENIIRTTDIFLNPIHTPMGNQGKMHKRREFLSQNEKYYFSTSNTKENSVDLSLESLQYAYHNGLPIEPIEVKQMTNSISRIFEIT